MLLHVQYLGSTLPTAEHCHWCQHQQAVEPEALHLSFNRLHLEGVRRRTTTAVGTVIGRAHSPPRIDLPSVGPAAPWAGPRPRGLRVSSLSDREPRSQLDFLGIRVLKYCTQYLSTST